MLCLRIIPWKKTRLSNPFCQVRGSGCLLTFLSSPLLILQKFHGVTTIHWLDYMCPRRPLIGIPKDARTRCAKHFNWIYNRQNWGKRNGRGRNRHLGWRYLLWVLGSGFWCRPSLTSIYLFMLFLPLSYFYLLINFHCWRCCGHLLYFSFSWELFSHLLFWCLSACTWCSYLSILVCWSSLLYELYKGDKSGSEVLFWNDGNFMFISQSKAFWYFCDFNGPSDALALYSHPSFSIENHYFNYRDNIGIQWCPWRGWGGCFFHYYLDTHGSSKMPRKGSNFTHVLLWYGSFSIISTFVMGIIIQLGESLILWDALIGHISSLKNFIVLD